MYFFFFLIVDYSSTTTINKSIYFSNIFHRFIKNIKEFIIILFTLDFTLIRKYTFSIFQMSQTKNLKNKICGINEVIPTIFNVLKKLWRILNRYVDHKKFVTSFLLVEFKILVEYEIYITRLSQFQKLLIKLSIKLSKVIRSIWQFVKGHTHRTMEILFENWLSMRGSHCQVFVIEKGQNKTWRGEKNESKKSMRCFHMDLVVPLSLRSCMIDGASFGCLHQCHLFFLFLSLVKIWTACHLRSDISYERYCFHSIYWNPSY